MHGFRMDFSLVQSHFSSILHGFKPVSMSFGLAAGAVGPHGELDLRQRGVGTTPELGRGCGDVGDGTGGLLRDQLLDFEVENR